MIQAFICPCGIENNGERGALDDLPNKKHKETHGSDHVGEINGVVEMKFIFK